jgi:hypothetical protein
MAARKRALSDAKLRACGSLVEAVLFAIDPRTIAARLLMTGIKIPPIVASKKATTGK